MSNLNDFWSLEHADPDNRKWTFLEFSRRITDLGPDPETSYQIISEELEPDQPVPFRIGHGRIRPDAYFNESGRLLVSGRLFRTMQQVGCKGLRAFAAVLYDRDDETLLDKDLFLIYPSRGAGPVDELRGNPLTLTDLQRWRRDPELKGCYGLFFDPKTWTGLDIFRATNHGAILVTTKIARAVQAGGFIGVELTPVPLYHKALRDARVAVIKKRHPNGPPPPDGPAPPGSPPVE